MAFVQHSGTLEGHKGSITALRYTVWLLFIRPHFVVLKVLLLCVCCIDRNYVVS